MALLLEDIGPVWLFLLLAFAGGAILPRTGRGGGDGGDRWFGGGDGGWFDGGGDGGGDGGS